MPSPKNDAVRMTPLSTPSDDLVRDVPVSSSMTHVTYSLEEPGKGCQSRLMTSEPGTLQDSMPVPRCLHARNIEAPSTWRPKTPEQPLSLPGSQGPRGRISDGREHLDSGAGRV